MVWYHGFIIETILELFPKKNREFLIKSFKILGWTLLLLGIIAILIGYTTSEPQSGFSGLGNVILFLGGIICCLVGFSLITGWFSVWQSRSLYDYDYEHSWSEIIGNMRNEDSSASGFVVAIVLGLMMILSVSIGALYFFADEDGLSFSGPSPQLIDWHYDHLSTSGFDEMGDWSGNGVQVCIIDTGIELNHPHLRDIQLAGWLDLIDNRSEPYDDEGHGTAMAGILVAHGSIPGVAQGVSLHVVKALDYSGSGNDETIASAVNWCINQETDIISMSLGGSPGFRFFGQSTDESENAVQDALDLGIFVVAAAGNDGGPDDDGDVESPGSIQRVICVGGHDRFGEIWEGSSEGDNDGGFFPPRLPNSDPDMKPEITAGGHEVAVLMATNSSGFTEYGWGSSSGTSAATAFATGAIALALEGSPNLKPGAVDGGQDAIESVKNHLMNSASNGNPEHDDLLGYGKLNAAKLFENVNGESPVNNSQNELHEFQDDFLSPITTNKVLIIGIDGVRGDVANIVSSEDNSAFGRMQQEGAWTYSSDVGPISVSGPSWSSMLTGVWCDRHGVFDNGFENHKLDSNPDIFELIESHDSSLDTTSLVYWEPIDSTIIGNDIADTQERFEEDEDLHSRAIEILQDDSSLDVLFVAYDDPDYAGHRHGFSPLSEEYVEAVKLADQRAFELLEILDERITIGEDWLVIITSDHGGGGAFEFSHSPSTEIDRTTLMMVRGGDTVLGEMENSVVVDVAVTALTHMDIPLPTGSNSLDGRALAFDPNSEDSRSPDCPKHISYTIAENSEAITAGLLGLSGFLIAASVIWYKRWKSKTNDESQQ
ncbi:MAG: S8 family serine peptidase [Candidatus Thalassarchaeaceae archaeon]